VSGSDWDRLWDGLEMGLRWGLRWAYGGHFDSPDVSQSNVR
jgi:hypothetical protein